MKARAPAQASAVPQDRAGRPEHSHDGAVAPSVLPTFVDGRADAMAQRELQKIASSSPQARQFAATQRMVCDSPYIAAQRHALDAAFGPILRPRDSVAVTGPHQYGARGSAAPIQRIIRKGAVDYPTTYRAIPDNLQASASAILDPVSASIAATYGSVNSKKLENAWNKLAKDAGATYDVDTDDDALHAALLSSYARSINAQSAYRGRSGQVGTLAEPLLANDSNLSLVPGARNPMVVHNAPEQIRHDRSMSKRRRMSTHVSTLGMARWPKGEEFQGSAQYSGKGMYLSSNRNATNNKVRNVISTASDIKQAAADFLLDQDIENMSREDAMADRVVRHVLKLYDRIREHLAADAPVTVPDSIPVLLDGVHAEIRIELDEGWNPDESEPPAGTKLPCLGCYFYFYGKKILLGHHYGPLWMTNAAMTMQLRDLLLAKVKIGKMSADQMQQVGGSLLQNYRQMPDDSTMAVGLDRRGQGSYAHDADSDSDFDPEQFDGLKRRFKARREGTSASPVWSGMDEWEPAEDRMVGANGTPALVEQANDAYAPEPVNVRPSVEDLSAEAHSQQSGPSSNDAGSSRRDVFLVNGTRYGTTHPQVRDGGECLWDTLRVYGYSNDQLAAAAARGSLQFDRSVDQKDISNLIAALSVETGQALSVHLDVFDIYTGEYRFSVASGNSSGKVLRIGLAVDEDGNGHYVPPVDI